MKKYILGILLGILLSSGVVYGANLYKSSDVTYNKNNKTNVEEALDELYDKVSYGNATAAQILTSKTALVNGTKITGTMKNNGAISQTLNVGESYIIPAGYHNGSGKVTASKNKILKYHISGETYTTKSVTFNIGSNYADYKSLVLNENLFINIGQLRVSTTATFNQADLRLNTTYDKNSGILTINSIANDRVDLSQYSTSYIDFYVIN